VSEHNGILLREGDLQLQKHVVEKYAQTMRDDPFSAMVPTKRTRGKDYTTADMKAKQKRAPKAAKALDASTVGQLLLKQMYWNRIIVDESHQCDYNEIDIIARLKADKRWCLSGTPAYGDLYDVAKMARLLGVQLPPWIDTTGRYETPECSRIPKGNDAL
jgi:superfamily II DNA or RNA helicase